MCYIADIFCEKDVFSGEVKIVSDKNDQRVYTLYYNKTTCTGGRMYVSNNRLCHVSSENETVICIFRNHRIINPKYKIKNDTRCCQKRIKRNDVIILMQKEKSNEILKEYLSELFKINRRRRNSKKKYISFDKIFSDIHVGDIFIMIQCIKNN